MMAVCGECWSRLPACVWIVNTWLVFFSSRWSDHPHHLHPGVLYKCECVLHCHLPCGHHPGHHAPAQHEASGDGGQVCVFSLSHLQTHLSYCHMLWYWRTRCSRFTASHLSPERQMVSILCTAPLLKDQPSLQRGIMTSWNLQFSFPVVHFLLPPPRRLRAASQVIRCAMRSAHQSLAVDLKRFPIRTLDSSLVWYSCCQHIVWLGDAPSNRFPHCQHLRCSFVGATWFWKSVQTELVVIVRNDFLGHWSAASR